MKNILLFFTVIGMMISGFFSGLSKPAEDLSARTDFNDAVVLNEADKELLRRIYETETAWIASLQLENGAIPMTRTDSGEVTVNPYFSDFAALALLDDAEKYADNVKAYIQWHLSHLNMAENDYNGIDGTIYDYTVTLENGAIIKEESKGSYDSTDSYAATFLMVLEKYYNKTGDSTLITENSVDIIRVYESMLETLNRGLTYAKPDYEVKYLMDNCEVYEGFKAAETILTLLNEKDCVNSLVVKKCALYKEKMSKTIEKRLWDSRNNNYKSGIFSNNKAISDFSWTEFYPCATSQLFPVTCGVIDSNTVRAQSLYNSFCENFSWEGFEIPSDFCWGANVYAAAVMGDTERVVEYMKNYEELFVSTHSYPLYNADAARVSMAAYLMLEA